MPETAPADAPQFGKDCVACCKTKRGCHPRSLNSNSGWNRTRTVPFLNFKLLEYAGEITAPVLIVRGEKAHSLYFGKAAFSKLRGSNKEMIIVPGASHTDLYDQKDKVLFDAIEALFRKSFQ